MISKVQCIVMRSQTLPGILLLVLLTTFRASAAPPLKPGELKSLISDLGNEKFAHRQAAQIRLIELGDDRFEEVIKACVLSYTDTDDVEVLVRLRNILFELVEKHLIDKPKGFLGIRLMRGVTLDQGGKSIPVIMVSYVFPDSSAGRAGLEVNDYILTVDKQPIPEEASVEFFVMYINSKVPGTKVALAVKRGDELLGIEAQLAERPANLPDQTLQESRKKAFFREWLERQIEELGRAEEDGSDTQPKPDTTD